MTAIKKCEICNYRPIEATRYKYCYDCWHDIIDPRTRKIPEVDPLQRLADRINDGIAAMKEANKQKDKFQVRHCQYHATDAWDGLFEAFDTTSELIVRVKPPAKTQAWLIPIEGACYTGVCGYQTAYGIEYLPESCAVHPSWIRVPQLDKKEGDK